jgi:hypothetical protein
MPPQVLPAPRHLSGDRGVTATVVIRYVEGRRHLPVVELGEAT